MVPEEYPQCLLPVVRVLFTSQNKSMDMAPINVAKDTTIDWIKTTFLDGHYLSHSLSITKPAMNEPHAGNYPICMSPIVFILRMPFYAYCNVCHLFNNVLYGLCAGVQNMKEYAQR